MIRLLVFALTLSLVTVGEGVCQHREASDRPDLLTLLEEGDTGELLAEVRARPQEVRDLLSDLFQETVDSPDSMDRVRFLEQARRLAEAYEQAWSDPFFLARVEEFSGWSIDERRDKLRADSLRLSGVEAYYGQGPEAAMRLWERCLTMLRSLDDGVGQAVVLGNLGSGYYALGDLERAHRYYGQSRELSEEVGDYRTLGNALGNLASVYKDQGEYAIAAQYYEEALKTRLLTGDRRGEAADINNLGLVSEALGDLKGAEEHYRRSLRLNQEDHRPREAANNLTNLGNLSTRRGRYAEAQDLYDQALQLRIETGDRQGEALDRQNLGLLYMSWGDYPGAVGSLERSLEILETLEIPVWAAEVRGDLAAAHAAMGHLRRGQNLLTAAIAEAGNDEALWSRLTMQQADLLTDLNEPEEAARLYGEASRRYERLNDARGQAQAQTGLGYLLLARGDFHRAEEAFSRALQVHELLGDVRPAATNLLRLGDARFLEGDEIGAREAYGEALATFRSLGDVVGQAVVTGALAEMDLGRGAFRRAEGGFDEALDCIRDIAVSPVRWHLRYGRGMALRAQGRLEEAYGAFLAGVEEVETLGTALGGAAGYYGFMEDKWALYAEVARVEAEMGRPRSALRTSERMRARQLLDLLGMGKTGWGSREDDLLREEETLRRSINRLSRELLASHELRAEPRDAARSEEELGEMRSSLSQLRDRHSALMGRLSDAAPTYAALISGSVAAVSEVQAALPSRTALVEYLVGDEWVLAVVVTGEVVSTQELPVERETLSQLVRFSRGTIGPMEDDELWRTPLRRLYTLLVAPLEASGLFRDVDRLVIAPHGELHYLPFQALLRDGPHGEEFLVEGFDIAYIPSASVWLELRDRRSGTAERGVLALAPHPEGLVHSGPEVSSLKDINPSAEILIGAQATERRFLELAPRFRMIHLATFGVLNTLNPLFSFVELNPDPPSDGRLEAQEIFGLPLNADLVVLSACETALGSGLRRDVPPGDDWMGLVQAFLLAGARSVLATLWNVDDEATSHFMERFYRGLAAGSSPAHALAETQRHMIRDHEHENPFYWAPFQLSGEGGSNLNSDENDGRKGTYR